MCRAPQPGDELVQSDLVAKVRHGVHISSPFAANLLAKTEDRAVVDELPEDVKEALEALEFESAPAPAPPNGPALPAEQLELMQAYAAGRNVYGVQGFT